MTITGDLQRARLLTYAGDSAAARDLLLGTVPAIEAADRDDQLLEVFAQLAEIYASRGVLAGAAECLTRIRDTLDSYAAIRAGKAPELAAHVTLPAADIELMCGRFGMRAAYLDTLLAAATGLHLEAARHLDALAARTPDAGGAQEHDRLLTAARIDCAVALGADELHAEAEPLWRDVLAALAEAERTGHTGPDQDDLLVRTGLGYGRFCAETGRFAEAQPWLRRAGAKASAAGWRLPAAQADLERAATAWAVGDMDTTERLIAEVYPVIAEYARTHDVARCWLYTGLTAMATGALERADECWSQAEQYWRELGKPIHLHRILLQRSWIPIFFGRFTDARQLIDEARSQLDSAPRTTWLQYARLDDHLGTVYRAEGLADLGFDAAGSPEDTWDELEARHIESLGIIDEEPGTAAHRRALIALGRAAELKIPAAIAVDSVRYTITDPERRSAWATGISAPALAGAFAVAWEAENTALVAELIEYHSARGVFADTAVPQAGGWAGTATALVPLAEDDDYALVAASPAQVSGTQQVLGPLPPLQMDPGADPLLGHYRMLARERYGRPVFDDTTIWSTWP